MTYALIPERHLLCRFMSDLNIWKGANTLGPKAKVLEGVSFTWTQVLTSWALWWQGKAFWPAPLQRVLLGFRLFCLGAAKKLPFVPSSEGGRQQRSQIVSMVWHRGENNTVTENGACGWTATESWFTLFSCIQPSEVSWDYSGPLLYEQDTSFFKCSDAWRWR